MFRLIHAINFTRVVGTFGEKTDCTLSVEVDCYPKCSARVGIHIPDIPTVVFEKNLTKGDPMTASGLFSKLLKEFKELESDDLLDSLNAQPFVDLGFKPTSQLIQADLP